MCLESINNDSLFKPKFFAIFLASLTSTNSKSIPSSSDNVIASASHFNQAL